VSSYFPVYQRVSHWKNSREIWNWELYESLSRKSKLG
jgi:hypothetical protein